MIDLFKVKMSKEASFEVSKVLSSGFIGQGPMVEHFEDLLWAELKTPTRPITTNSCTSSIDLALSLCDVTVGDEIIATPLTCFASQVGAIHKGATIVWADIDQNTGLIDPKDVAKKITSKTKAIVCVNWGGKLCDYSELKKNNISIIEDCAHTWDVFGETDNLARGDYRCYSFQAIKYLTTSDGGLLVCPKEKEERARLLRWFGLDRTKGQSFRCAQDISEAGFKYHMNDVCAAIGISNIKEARISVETQRSVSKFYCENIKNKRVWISPYDKNCSYWLFSILILDGSVDNFTKYMNGLGISVSPVHHRNDKYSCVSHFDLGGLRGVDMFSSMQINIPNGWWLSKEEIDFVVSKVNGY